MNFWPLALVFATADHIQSAVESIECRKGQTQLNENAIEIERAALEFESGFLRLDLILNAQNSSLAQRTFSVVCVLIQRTIAPSDWTDGQRFFYGSMAARGSSEGEFGSEPVEDGCSGLLEDREDEGNADGDGRVGRFRLTSTV